MWPTLENRPSARGWTGPSGRTSGSMDAAPELDRERVVGTGLSSLTQVQREVDGVGVLHPGQHSLALPPGGVGLVVVVGQEGCPVLQVLLAGVAQVTGLSDSGHPSLHAVLLGRSPTRVGSHHGHIEGGINKLRHAALRPPALIRALVHGRPDTARHSRQHSQQRPQPPPGLQGQRGPPAARHPAARGPSAKAGVPRCTRLAAYPEADPPLRAEAGLWTGLEAESRTQSRWVGVRAKIALPPLPPGAQPALCADPRLPSAHSRARPRRKEKGVGSARRGGIWRWRKPKAGLLGSSRGPGAAPRPTRPPQRLPAAAGAAWRAVGQRSEMGGAGARGPGARWAGRWSRRVGCEEGGTGSKREGGARWKRQGVKWEDFWMGVTRGGLGEGVRGRGPRWAERERE